MSSAIGKPPSWPDFSGDDLLSFLDAFRQAQQDAGGLNMNSPVMPRGAGEVDPTGRGTGPIDQRRPPQLAMNEGQTQALEQAMASPADRGALGPRPGSADALAFDRTPMGGGLNPFAGRADPFGARPIPLPPGRPSDADLMMPPPAPTVTGSVSGMNPGGGSFVPPGGAGVPANTAPQRQAPSALPAPQAQAPAADPAGTPPANAFDPLTGQVVAGAPQRLGAPQAGGPSPAPAGAMPPTAASPPGVSDMFGKFLTGIQNPEVSNLLLNMGIGLLSNRGFGPGLAAGLQGYQNSSNGLVKQQLEQFKLQQMVQGQQSLRADLIRRGFSPAQAEAAVYNPTILSDMLARDKPNYQTVGGNIYDMNRNGGVPGSANLIGPSSGPPANYRLSDDGKSYVYITGSEADPAVKERNALAVATDKTQTPLMDIEARRKAGIPDNDTRSAWADPYGKVTFNDGPPLLSPRPGQTLYERGTLKPIVTAPPAKPDSFDTETKLRTEFSKQLGSFADVHDGYNRVIAATKQRQDTPGAVSPAADIGLIFGYMKMLDPGSVVREGEYATAKNAAGVPDRVLNAYNKALNGEFLTDRQRQDFVTQADNLYGGARKTAEGVADRYRGLATQYSVDPGRSVYLPDAPTPPRLGGQGQQAPQQTRTPATLPQGSPDGTRLAPDGKFYAPDPARPGRFLEVR